jgi:adenylate kinase
MSPLNTLDREAWFEGPSPRCEVRLAVLLGDPGVGKGTQADLLTQRRRACHLSTGDVFRTAMAGSECEQSPAMKEALGQMRRGGGLILDGFPRTLDQAELQRQFLESEGLSLTAVLNYELPASVIKAAARWPPDLREVQGSIPPD